MPTAELKQQLVDCIRMLEQSDIIDYNGHCSVRIDDKHLLINSGSCQRSKLTVDDLCTIDLDANQIEGKDNAPLESVGSIMGNEADRLVDSASRQQIAAIQQAAQLPQAGGARGGCRPS